MSENVQSSWLERNFGRIGLLSFAVAMIGVLTGLSAGVLYRIDVIDLLTSLRTVLPMGAYISAAGAALCLLTLIGAIVFYKGDFISKSLFPLLGLVIAGVATYIPYAQQQLGGSVPPIHDISTDTSDPPRFVDIVPLRIADDAPNPAEYLVYYERRGEILNVPELQKEAYPDIQPVTFPNKSTEEAFDLALEAAQQQSWTIVAEDKDDGRIEAWHKTTFMGFVDDVVIRIRPQGAGSVLDIRSKSRLGGSDVGKNAQRIRAYLNTLKNLEG